MKLELVLNNGWERTKTDLGIVLVIQNKNWEVMENEQKVENTRAKSQSWVEPAQICTYNMNFKV